jgi:hypothetical protein
MNHWFLSLLLLLPASLPSQDSAPIDNTGCPIGWSAHHTRIDPDGDAASAPHQVAISVGAQITLNGHRLPPASNIVSISGIFHGPSKPTEEALANHKASPEEIANLGKNIQTFHSEAGSGTVISFQYWIGALKSVDWVELTSLGFSDGSEWRPSPTSHCALANEQLVRKVK